MRQRETERRAGREREKETDRDDAGRERRVGNDAGEKEKGRG